MLCVFLKQFWRQNPEDEDIIIPTQIGAMWQMYIVQITSVESVGITWVFVLS